MTDHRPAPHDPDAEAQVIGAALSTASRYPRPNLIPSDFWVPAHRQLWELITTTTGPYCPGDLPEDLRDAGRGAVSVWTGIDPAIPAKRLFSQTACRMVISEVNEVLAAAYDGDVSRLRSAVETLDSILTMTPRVEES